MKIYRVGEPRYFYIIQLTVIIEQISKLKSKQNNVLLLWTNYEFVLTNIKQTKKKILVELPCKSGSKSFIRNGFNFCFSAFPDSARRFALFFPSMASKNSFGRKLLSHFIGTYLRIVLHNFWRTLYDLD